MKVQNPIIGGARGSAGGMTFCKIYDKNVARAKAFEVSNPKTPAQQTQRAYFKQLSGLVAQFSDEELRTLFPNKPKAMSRRNALSKQLAEDVTVVNNQKVVAYAGIDTLGNAPTMDFGDVVVNIANQAIFAILDSKVANNPVYANNLCIFAFVNEDKGEIYFPGEFATVADNDYQAVLPGGWTDEDSIHAIPFITSGTSDDTGGFVMGTMVVIKRPVKAAL